MLTLASDFPDPYPAAMRGVVYDRCGGDLTLVDVAHDLPRGDVEAAAFWLAQVLPYVPPAVHCAVVDPTVGTDRAVLLARVGEHALVGPDNGLCLPAARAIAAGDPDAALVAGGDGSDPEGPAPTVALGADRDADVELFVRSVADPASNTFHGRDVFAPTAAAVHEAGVDALESVAGVEPAPSYVDCTFPRPTVRDDGASGTVLVVDGFGNVITNVPGSVLTDREAVTVTAGDTDAERVPVGRSYAAVPAGRRLATVGSHGNVELAVDHGRGDEAFGVGAGDAVDLRWGGDGD
ncbi:MAG: S-adenosyl-l-methionine hydroxide adenosyltransferase family protein [Halobacteriaceae archaeon]